MTMRIIDADEDDSSNDNDDFLMKFKISFTLTACQFFCNLVTNTSIYLM